MKLIPWCTFFTHSLLLSSQTPPQNYRDVTLGYVDRNNVRCSEKSILKGELPSRIVCHCTRFPRKDLQKVKDVEAWLRSRFDTKEQVLRDFYEKKCTEFKDLALLSNMPGTPGVLTSYLFWLFLSLFAWYLLFFHLYIFMGILMSSTSFFISMKYLYGGVDRYLLSKSL